VWARSVVKQAVEWKREAGRRGSDIVKGDTGMSIGGQGLDRSPVIGLSVGLDCRLVVQLVLERHGC